MMLVHALPTSGDGDVQQADTDVQIAEDDPYFQLADAWAGHAGTGDVF